MKRFPPCLFYAGLLFFLSTTISAQVCRTTPTAQMDFAVNAVTATLLTGGDLWWDGGNAGHQVINPSNPPDAAPVRTLFLGGLWLSANDADGQLRFRAQQYGRGTNDFDYAPGPLQQDGTGYPNCGDWDRFFLITRGQVDTLMELAQAGEPIDVSRIPENVLAWPAAGNPYFSQVNGFDLPDTPQGYAPFQDQNDDGIYDPASGDYPLFLGDAAAWLVYSSAEIARESNYPYPLPLEIQLMVYAWKSESNVVNQTTFYQYRIISRAEEELYDFRAGHSIDYDLGCPGNEYSGSNPGRDLFFGYNENAVEPADCGSRAYVSNLANAPVSMFQLVDSPHHQTDSTEAIMESFSLRGALSENPESAGFVSLGIWQDSVLLTRGGTGYNPGTNREPTKFMFDGGEVDGQPWRMCAEEIAPVNLHTRYTTQPRQLSPGGVTGFTLAESTIFGVDYNEGCPDLETIYTNADFVRQFYATEKQMAGIVSSTRPNSTQIILKVFPNPTSDRVSFTLPDDHMAASISLFDLTGRLMLQENPQSDNFSLSFDQGQLPASTYFYRLLTTKGDILTGKLMVR